jgi:hypothetical protein
MKKPTQPCTACVDFVFLHREKELSGGGLVVDGKINSPNFTF